MQSNSNKNMIISATIIGATVLLIMGAVVVKGQPSTTPTTSTTSSTPASKPSNDSSGTTTSTSPYKDGTYSATGRYSAPDGTQQIGITMTISNGTVTATSAENKANGRDSSQYEDSFIASYKDSVVGKKIDSLKGVVSGDLLTLIGFEDALAQIENQAKA
ncbi:hypothetical protein HY004_03170 [Candidatus Saccharibacteria bacterium]|nr:hypothetical protein [Candidatus Saccharibacteria bacterium]